MNKSISTAKSRLNKLRIEEQEIIAENKPLGEETIPVHPDNLTLMYAGKMAAMGLKMDVASSNILESYLRSYKEIDDETRNTLLDLSNSYSKSFESYKRKVSKIIEKHPLWDRLGIIKGFSPYQLGLLVSYIKDISRFELPSKLCVYAGIGAINGIPVTKANIKRISEYMIKTHGREFKGFNTILAGRLHVIAECLIRSKGFFYQKYLLFKSRLIEQAANQGRCITLAKMIENGDKITPEMKKKPGDTLYMKGKKNQSLISYADKGAKRRMIAIFLHLLWKEWRELEGLSTREPYVQEYLGHSSIITIEEIKKADKKPE